MSQINVSQTSPRVLLRPARTINSPCNALPLTSPSPRGVSSAINNNASGTGIGSAIFGNTSVRVSPAATQPSPIPPPVGMGGTAMKSSSSNGRPPRIQLPSEHEGSPGLGAVGGSGRPTGFGSYILSFSPPAGGDSSGTNSQRRGSISSRIVPTTKTAPKRNSYAPPATSGVAAMSFEIESPLSPAPELGTGSFLKSPNRIETVSTSNSSSSVAKVVAAQRPLSSSEGIHGNNKAASDFSSKLLTLSIGNTAALSARPPVRNSNQSNPSPRVNVAGSVNATHSGFTDNSEGWTPTMAKTPSNNSGAAVSGSLAWGSPTDSAQKKTTYASPNLKKANVGVRRISAASSASSGRHSKAEIGPGDRPPKGKDSVNDRSHSPKTESISTPSSNSNQTGKLHDLALFECSVRE
eukprot:Filipodium_phascolosomae@DN6950_c0_g1_i1.p1